MFGVRWRVCGGDGTTCARLTTIPGFCLIKIHRFFDVAFSVGDISGIHRFRIVFGVVIDVSICDFVNMRIHRRAMSCDAAEGGGHVSGCSFAVVSVASCGRDDKHHVIRRCIHSNLMALMMGWQRLVGSQNC